MGQFSIAVDSVPSHDINEDSLRVMLERYRRLDIDSLSENFLTTLGFSKNHYAINFNAMDFKRFKKILSFDFFAFMSQREHQTQYCSGYTEVDTYLRAHPVQSLASFSFERTDSNKLFSMGRKVAGVPMEGNQESTWLNSKKMDVRRVSLWLLGEIEKLGLMDNPAISQIQERFSKKIADGIQEQLAANPEYLRSPEAIAKYLDIQVTKKYLGKSSYFDYGDNFNDELQPMNELEKILLNKLFDMQAIAEMKPQEKDQYIRNEITKLKHTAINDLHQKIFQTLVDFYNKCGDQLRGSNDEVVQKIRKEIKLLSNLSFQFFSFKKKSYEMPEVYEYQSLLAGR